MPRSHDDESEEWEPGDADDDASDSGREDPDESDADDDDEPAVVPCPQCGASISEDAEICPRCGNFISHEDARRRHPWWIWAGLVLGLLVVLVWVFAGT